MASTRRNRYPLDALLRLRREIRKRREQELAGAVARLGDAEGVEAEARRRAEAGQAAAARAAAALSEIGAPVRSGAAIQEQERYHRRLRAQAEAAEQAASRAAEEVARCREALDAARVDLARAEADLELVEKDREAWDLSRRKEATRKAEQELEDLVAARHGRKV